MIGEKKNRRCAGSFYICNKNDALLNIIVISSKMLYNGIYFEGVQIDGDQFQKTLEATDR